MKNLQFAESFTYPDVSGQREQAQRIAPQAQSPVRPAPWSIFGNSVNYEDLLDVAFPLRKATLTVAG
jgi:hypothetical protein